VIRSILDRRTLDGPMTTVSEGDEELGETRRVLYIEYHRPRGRSGPVVVIPSKKADGRDIALEKAELSEVVAEARKVDPKPVDDEVIEREVIDVTR